MKKLFFGLILAGTLVSFSSAEVENVEELDNCCVQGGGAAACASTCELAYQQWKQMIAE